MGQEGSLGGNRGEGVGPNVRREGRDTDRSFPGEEHAGGGVGGGAKFGLLGALFGGRKENQARSSVQESGNRG